MNFEIITLFPEMLEALAHHGVTGRAHRDGLWRYRCWNPRDYSDNNYRAVDDRPFGGGAGMVMMSSPVEEAVSAAQAARTGDEMLPVIAFTPQGAPLTYAWVRHFAQGQGAILLCGRYEGFDQRILDRSVSIELSLGDFVVSGGEIPALALIDACVRLLPGALGNEASSAEESFTAGLLEYPQYTRPHEDLGMKIPEVLNSGHHEKIHRWRHQQALGRTWSRRPELLPPLEATDQHLLDELRHHWAASALPS